MSKTEEKRAAKRKENAEKRAAKRAAPKVRPQARTPNPSEQGHFIGKVRRGDALTIEFQFSGLPVPFFDEKDPSKGVLEQVRLLHEMTEKAEAEEPN